MIQSGYDVLFDASKATFGADRSAGLPPDWVGIERATGNLAPLKLNNRETTNYGFDAARTYWRVALDAHWYNDGHASTYLQQAGFLKDEVNRLLADGITRKHRVSAVYARNGAVIEEAPSLVGTAGAIGALLTLDRSSAGVLHAAQLVGGANRSSSGIYWGNPSDLYGQEWGWFSVALYADALPNLWNNATSAR